MGIASKVRLNEKEAGMPDKDTSERARHDAEQGKSPCTQAGEFVREEIRHVRERGHGARSGECQRSVASRAEASILTRRPSPSAQHEKKYLLRLELLDCLVLVRCSGGVMNRYSPLLQPLSRLPLFWQTHCSVKTSSRKGFVGGKPMPGKNIAVFGIYPHRASFEYAHRALEEAGFRDTDISVLLQENPGTKDLATEKTTKAPEGAATGAGSGAIIGGALAWLAATGVLGVPGLGPFIIAGPVIATLAGIGIGGTLGGLAGALLGLGIPEYEAKRYQGRIENGGILLSVHCDNPQWVNKAKQLLSSTGAEDISSTSESAADYDSADRPGRRAAFG